MDNGFEKIEDGGLRDQLRRQARGILLKATVAGAALTAVVVALP